MSYWSSLLSADKAAIKSRVLQLKWDAEELERVQRKGSQPPRACNLQEESEGVLSSLSDGEEAK